MKKLLVILIVLGAGHGNAQQLELNELKTPSTPAFTILGLSPTDISRPTLTEPFFMSLANGLNNGAIASDVAIEATPYWWLPRPKLTYRKYYGLKDEEGKSASSFMERLGRTVAISVATSDASPAIDSMESRNIAAGIRFQVLPGHPSQSFKKTYNGSLQDRLLIREAIADLQRKIDSDKIISRDGLIAEVPKSVKSLAELNAAYKELSRRQKEEKQKLATDYILEKIADMPSEDFDKSKVKTFLETERGKVSDQVNEIIIEMGKMSRVGWLWEFAGAASLLAPTNNIEYTLGQDWAGWTTLTYRFEPEDGDRNFKDINIMGRIGGDFQNSKSYNYDLGLSWVLLGDNYSFTLEGILRTYRTYFEITATDGNVYEVSETDATWRFALAYQYKFSDVINVSLTAGKDYENSKITTGGFFSLLNLNFALPVKESIKVQ